MSSEWCANQQVPKFLADSNGETTYASQLIDHLNTALLFIVPLLLQGVTSYFDVYYPIIAEYDDNEVPKIHLTAEECLGTHQQKKTQKGRFM